MPGMNGIETATQVKQRERTQDIPIVFLTAFDATTAPARRGGLLVAARSTGSPSRSTPTILRAKVRGASSTCTSAARRCAPERAVSAHQLDAPLRRSKRGHLRKLADAALAINSTSVLAEMLRTINDSAAEVTAARSADAVLADGRPASTTTRRPGRRQLCAGRHAGGMPSADVGEGRGGSVRLVLALLDVAAGHPALEGWLAVPLVGRTGSASRHHPGRRQGRRRLHRVRRDDAPPARAAGRRRHRERRAIRASSTRSRRTLQRGPAPRIAAGRAGARRPAARYRARRSAGTQVGGDWYDVVHARRWSVVPTIGDVDGSRRPIRRGHGPGADRAPRLCAAGPSAGGRDPLRRHAAAGRQRRHGDRRLRGAGSGHRPHRARRRPATPRRCSSAPMAGSPISTSHPHTRSASWRTASYHVGRRASLRLDAAAVHRRADRGPLDRRRGGPRHAGRVDRRLGALASTARVETIIQTLAPDTRDDYVAVLAVRLL